MPERTIDERLDALERASPGAGEVKVPGVGMLTMGAAKWTFGAAMAVLLAASGWFWNDRETLLATIAGLEEQVARQTALLAEVKDEVKALREDLASEMRRVTPKDLRLCIEAAYSEDPSKMESCRVLLLAKDYEVRAP